MSASPPHTSGLPASRSQRSLRGFARSRASSVHSILSFRSVAMPALHKWTLEFEDADLNEGYDKYFVRTYGKSVRRFFVIGAVFYLVFNVAFLLGRSADELINKTEFETMLVLRIASSVLTLGILLSMFKTNAHFQIKGALMTGSISVAVALELVLVDMWDEDQRGQPGLLLLLAACTIIGRVRVKYFYVVSGLSYALYAGSQYPATQADPGVEVSQAAMNCFFMAISVTILVIGAYNSESVQRVSFIHSRSLETDNSNLRNQLQVIRKKLDPNKINLETPIEHAINALRRTLATPNLLPTVLPDLEMVFEVLSTQNFHQTNLRKQIKSGKTNMDQETKAWLFYEVAAKENTPRRKFGSLDPISRVGRPQRPSSAGSILHVLLPDEERQLNELLGTVDQWDFDVFRLAKLTHGRPLYFLSMHIFKSLGLLTSFGINASKFAKFASKIEESYRDNPYHNSTHAADVLHGCLYFLRLPRIEEMVNDLDMLSVLLAAMIHDADHGGLNNNFQVVTKSDLAVMYNDRSVLENHHCATGFRTMLDDKTNILSSLTDTQYKGLRETIVDLVLATDIGRHFEILSTFKSRIETLEPEKRSDTLLVLQMLVKCADVSNPAKPRALYQEWGAAVTEEFFRQGDKERASNLPVSPFMDRHKPAYEKSQSGFIQFIVLPIYEVFVDAFGTPETPCLKHCQDHLADMQQTIATASSMSVAIQKPSDDTLSESDED